MFTNEEAKYLLELPKILETNDIVIDLRESKTRLNIISTDQEWKFIVDIFSNKKITFRICMHHQEDNNKEGLLRIDFKQGHRNPDTINDYVPNFLHPFAGKWFQNESHIHVFVESYKNLAWAIPLREYDKFPIKEINSYSDFSRSIRCFAEQINLVSKFTIQEAIL